MTGRGQGTCHPTILALMTSDAMPPDLGVRNLFKPSIDIILLGHRERARGTRRDAVERQDKGRISLHSIRAPSVQASTTTNSSCPTQHCMALSPGSQGRFPHWETLRVTHSICLCLVTRVMTWHRTKTQTRDPSYRRVFKRIPTYPKHALFIQKEKRGLAGKLWPLCD